MTVVLPASTGAEAQWLVWLGKAAGTDGGSGPGR